MQGTGTVKGPVPANGKSDQRLSDNSVVAATPTPKAANKADVTGKPFAGVSFPGKHKVKVDSKRRARIKLACPKGTGGCTGRLKLRSVSGTPKSLGSGKFTIGGGHAKRVVVKLSPAAMKRLKSAGHLKVKAVASARDAAGHPHQTKATLKLLAP
jgi:hypothetical protein